MAIENTSPLSQYNFGEYDARREFLRDQKFFIESFIDPMSFQINTLNGGKNFIIVGQKGAGKTACQLYLEKTKEQNEGYICDLLSFYDDLQAEDYRNFSKTQKINLLDMGNIKNIDLLYDYKEIWKRFIYLRIAKVLSNNGFDNLFISYCRSSSSGANNFIDGLKKSLKVEVKLPVMNLEAKVSFDPSVFNGNELSLANFNKIAEQLLISECMPYRLYFFIDELVISTYNTRSDEYKIRVALIRDIVRICCYFNDTCFRNNLDMHFICNLRPEIRTMLNSIDPEISKIMDGNDVFLSWDDDSLFNIMVNKIVNGAPKGSRPDADTFFPKTIKLGNHAQEYMKFILNQTWRKPRDIVRFLKSYAKINPRDRVITVEGTKNCLNEYARISAVEIFEQLSVDYSSSILESIRGGIRSKTYNNAAQLGDSLRLEMSDREIEKVLNRLYQVGVIGNIDKSHANSRYFFYHRQEENLDPDMEVTVHNGLWNFFNIRHR